MISQFKKIRSRGQNLSWDLNGGTEAHDGGFVRLVGMGSEFEEKSKSNDQTYSNVTFVDFHMIHLLEKYLCFDPTLEKKLDDRFCCLAGVLGRHLRGLVGVFARNLSGVTHNVGSE
jgi:hypothetical protein